METPQSYVALKMDTEVIGGIPLVGYKGGLEKEISYIEKKCSGNYEGFASHLERDHDIIDEAIKTWKMCSLFKKRISGGFTTNLLYKIHQRITFLLEEKSKKGDQFDLWGFNKMHPETIKDNDDLTMEKKMELENYLNGVYGELGNRLKGSSYLKDGDKWVLPFIKRNKMAEMTNNYKYKM